MVDNIMGSTIHADIHDLDLIIDRLNTVLLGQ